MITLDDIKGLTIAGYRYGIAPESGYSYNTRECEYEPGVSMAKVGYCKEINSFAVLAQESKKYYYVGVIAGIGGDDEICLENVKRLSKAEYDEILANMKEVNNMIVDYYADRKLRLIERGFNIGMTCEQIEDFRNQYKVK